LDRQRDDRRAPGALDDLLDALRQVEQRCGLVELPFGVGERIELLLGIAALGRHGTSGRMAPHGWNVMEAASGAVYLRLERASNFGVRPRRRREAAAAVSLGTSS